MTGVTVSKNRYTMSVVSAPSPLAGKWKVIMLRKSPQSLLRSRDKMVILMVILFAVNT